MKLKGLLTLGLALCLGKTAFAADQVVKEEINPPAAEGALTVDQIPPIYSPAAKPATAPTAAPAEQEPNQPAAPQSQQTPTQPPPGIISDTQPPTPSDAEPATAPPIANPPTTLQ